MRSVLALSKKHQPAPVPDTSGDPVGPTMLVFLPLIPLCSLPMPTSGTTSAPAVEAEVGAEVGDVGGRLTWSSFLEEVRESMRESVLEALLLQLRDPCCDENGGATFEAGLEAEAFETGLGGMVDKVECKMLDEMIDAAIVKEVESTKMEAVVCEDPDACPGPRVVPTRYSVPSLSGVAHRLTRSRDCIALSPAQMTCSGARSPVLPRASSETSAPRRSGCGSLASEEVLTHSMPWTRSGRVTTRPSCGCQCLSLPPSGGRGGASSSTSRRRVGDRAASARFTPSGWLSTQRRLTAPPRPTLLRSKGTLAAFGCCTSLGQGHPSPRPTRTAGHQLISLHSVDIQTASGCCTSLALARHFSSQTDAGTSQPIVRRCMGTRAASGHWTTLAPGCCFRLLPGPA